MNSDTLTVLAVVFGVGLVAYLLVRQQEISAPPVVPKGESLGGIAGPGDAYSKAFNLLSTALTNPNSIQHAFGLPGSDGFGEGIFAADFNDLPLDEKIYKLMSVSAHMSQHGDVNMENRKKFYARAIYLMPALNEGTCCDFDPRVPLAKGGGSMEYHGNYLVSFNQDGRQRTGALRRISADEVNAIYKGATPYPPFIGTIHYPT